MKHVNSVSAIPVYPAPAQPAVGFQLASVSTVIASKDANDGIDAFCFAFRA